LKTKPNPVTLRGSRPDEIVFQEENLNLPVYPLPDERPTWRKMLWLALGLVVLYFVTARPIPQSDPAARSAFALTAAIATEQTSTIDSFVQTAQGFFLSKPGDYPNAAYYQGHYYSDSAPGAGLFAVPFYQLGRITGDFLASLSPDSNAPLEAPPAFGLLAMVLAGVGTVLLFYAAARRLGSAQSGSFYAALTLGLASALWREAGHFGSPAISLFLLMATLFLAFPRLPRQLQAEGKVSERLNLWQSGLIGLLLGLAIMVDLGNLTWTPLFLIYLLWAKRLHPAGWPFLALGWLVGFLPLILYNWFIFGVPWAFTYGYLVSNPEARTLTGQFLSGFKLDNLRQLFFGDGRAVFGPFLFFFGTWGLIALYGQRGKRKETLLLLGLMVSGLVLALLRRPVGEGIQRIDFGVAMLPAFAFGVAVWHERFQFLTRLEQTWLPPLALWGTALYYLIASPGPRFNNLDGLAYFWPFLLIAGLIGLVAWKAPGLKIGQKGFAFTAALIVFCLLGLALNSPFKPAYGAPDSANSNNLLYNPKFEQCQNGKLAGWYSAVKCISQDKGSRFAPNSQLQPYLIPVQGGESYTFRLSLNEKATNLTITWAWSDEGHNPLPGQVSYNWPELTPEKPLSDVRAAPPGAVYLQLIIDSPQELSCQEAVLYNNSPRLEPIKNYAKAALSFSFDWESAMGGLIHSKGGAAFSEGGEAGGIALDDSNRQKAVAYAEDRGMAMREGADNLLEFFQQFDIHGTFYATGYNLLDGNTEKNQFLGNPIYKWASTKNLWANDYWTTHPWYGDDPFGTFITKPAWYFGDQTDRLLKAGQDIQSHTFGHLYVRGTSIAEFAADMQTWLSYARAKGIQARSFAFPWQSSNSLDKSDHFKVLANLGFLSVTRLYDGDQGKQENGEGVLRYDNGKLNDNHQRIYEDEAGPQNYYYYLNRVKNEPRLLVLNDYNMVHGDKSENQAKALIDQLLMRRGYGSIWTHPEAVVDPSDKGQWQRVIQYAASKRDAGLWIDSVTNLIQHRLDIQKIGVETNYSRDGAKQRVRLTLTNYNDHSVDGLTLTMPGKISQIILPGGKNYQEFKGAQLVAPKLDAGQALTLVVYLD
jgi:peptidoglycan/xylan/chitin deacetylase (PgdA/CDA1 family)